MRQKRSLVYTYLFSYMGLTCLLLVLLLPIYNISFQVAQDAALTEIRSNLERSTRSWERDIQSIYQLHTLLNSEEFLAIKSCPSDGFVPLQYYKLEKLHELFTKLCSGISNTADLFILFDRNDKVVTAHDIFDTYQAFFSSAYQFENHAPEDIYREITCQQNSISYIGQIMVQQYSRTPSKYLLIVTRPKGNSAVICAMYQAENLRAILGISPDIPNIILQFCDTDGHLLFADGDAPDEKLLSIECTLSPRGEKISISIPESYFAARVVPVRRVIFSYICIAAAVGLLLSVISSFQNYAPIRRLVRHYSTAYPDIAKDANELVYLNRINLHNEEEKRRLTEQLTQNRQHLQSSLLINLMCGMADLQNPVFAELLPYDVLPCRVAVWCSTAGNTAPSPARALFVYLQSLGMPVVHLSHDQYAALLAGERYTHFLDILPKHEEDALHASVSQSCDSLSGIHDCFLQAQSSLSLNGILTQVSDSTPPINLRQLADIQSLQSEIIAGDEEQIHKIFELTAASDALRSPRTAAWVFYHLRCAPVLVLCDSRFANLADTVPLFDSGKPVIPQFEALEALCIKLAAVGTVHAKNVSDYQLQLIAYINEHFSNPDLYIDAVASYFHISSRQVSRIVHEITGLGFAEYIGRLRMEQAANLLLTSSMSINDISAACGFSMPNTFYKFFKRTYGISPSNYRR